MWTTCSLNKNPIWCSSTPKSSSCIWRKIKKCAHHLQQGSRWQIGNSTTADLWFDAWAEDTSIASKFSHFSFPPNQKLASLKTGDTWTILLDFPSNIAAFLTMAIQDLSFNLQEDKVFWKNHPSRALSFKDAWQTVRSRNTYVDWLL